MRAQSSLSRFPSLQNHSCGLPAPKAGAARAVSPAGRGQQFGIGAEVAVGQWAIVPNLAAEVIQGL